MNEFFNFIKDNPKVLMLVVTLIITAIQAIKEHKGKGDIALLLLNTLKDESKMEGGNIFSDETIAKIDKVAKLTDSSVATVEKVKQTINDANRQSGIKIGSLKGKPIFLRDAAQFSPIGSSLTAALGVLRGIIRR